jgi:ASC-1-like (ASCH) protein
MRVVYEEEKKVKCGDRMRHNNEEVQFSFSFLRETQGFNCYISIHAYNTF